MANQLLIVETLHESVLAGTAEGDRRQLETDLDAEYRTWRHRIDSEMAALAEELGGRLEPPRPQPERQATRKPPERDAIAAPSAVTPSRRVWALAASIVVALGLGLLAGRTWEQVRLDPHIAQLEAERGDLEREKEQLATEFESERRELEEQMKEERRRGQTALEKEQQASQLRLAEVEEHWRSRLNEADQPEAQPIFSFVPRGRQRGTEKLRLQPEARTVLFEIDGVEDGDTVEIREWPPGEVIWRATLGEVESVLFRVLLPARFFPPGEIQVRVLREDTVVTVKRLLVVGADDSVEKWP